MPDSKSLNLAQRPVGQHVGQTAICQPCGSDVLGRPPQTVTEPHQFGHAFPCIRREFAVGIQGHGVTVGGDKSIIIPMRRKYDPVPVAHIGGVPRFGAPLQPCR